MANSWRLRDEYDNGFVRLMMFHILYFEFDITHENHCFHSQSIFCLELSTSLDLVLYFYLSSRPPFDCRLVLNIVQ